MANETQFIVAVGVAAILVVYFTQGQEKEKVQAAQPRVIVEVKDESGIVKEKAVIPVADIWQEFLRRLTRLKVEYRSIESVIGDAAKAQGAKGVSRGLREKMEELQEKMPSFLADLQTFTSEHSGFFDASHSPFMDTALINEAQLLNRAIAAAVSKLGIVRPSLTQSATYQYQQNVVNSVPLAHRVGLIPGRSREHHAMPAITYDQEGQPGSGEQLRIQDKPFVQGEPGAEAVIKAADDRRDGKGGEKEGGCRPERRLQLRARHRPGYRGHRGQVQS